MDESIKEPEIKIQDDAKNRETGDSILNKKAKLWTRFIIIIVIIFYLLFLLPFIIHSSIDNIVVVEEVKNVNANKIPIDIRDVLRDSKPDYDVLLVKDAISRRLSVVIPNSGDYKQGSVVRLSAIEMEIFIDKHTIDLFSSPYSQLKIADAYRVNFVEEVSERFIASYFGKIVFILSKVIFYTGPLLLIFLTSYLLRQKLSIWMFTGALSIFSIEFFISNMISDLYGIIISDTMTYFGYLFILLLPVTIKIFFYENSPGGKTKIEHLAKQIMEKKDKGIYYRKIF